MSAGNGHDITPPSGTAVPTESASVLPRLDDKSERWLLEESVRRSHHAWECAAGTAEWQKEFTVYADKRFKGLEGAIGRVEKRLGIVETREGSHPQLEQLVSLRLEDEATEVRRRRLDLEEIERQRIERAKSRAKALAIFWRVAAILSTGAAGWLLARACN